MTELHNTPNIELGKFVVEALISEGLIMPENKETLLSKICDGKMAANEWRSCIEMKIIKDEGKDNDGKSDQKN